MAAELPSSQLATVGALFAAVPQDQTFIRAAMRDPKSRLLVDDPSVALLWPAVGNVAFLAGRRQPHNGALADVVRKNIGTATYFRAAKTGDCPYLLDAHARR